MIEIRDRNARGRFENDWLNSRHSFSFGGYHDPDHMGFGPLRVINEDRVAPSGGFATHPHSNMEIVSYVLDGELAHKDSMGNGSTIKAGDIQRMSAGTGIRHSEFNPSSDTPVHFLQIWFLPEKENIKPDYAQRSIDEKAISGQFGLVMSRTGANGSLAIHQDINMFVGRFNGNERGTFQTQKERIQWVQIARGTIDLNGKTLREGDGAAIMDEAHLDFDNAVNAEVILFDMPKNPPILN